MAVFPNASEYTIQHAYASRALHKFLSAHRSHAQHSFSSSCNAAASSAAGATTPPTRALADVPAMSRQGFHSYLHRIDRFPSKIRANILLISLCSPCASYCCPSRGICSISATPCGALRRSHGQWQTVHILQAAHSERTIPEFTRIQMHTILGW